MYVSVDETGRILATTEFEEYAEGMSEFIFPDDFDFGTQNEYRIVDGELVHDPLPESPETQIADLKAKLAETDYVVIKVYEAMVTESELPDDDVQRYSSIIQQRGLWREQINQLESEVSNIG